MKTYEEIKQAREVITAALVRGGLSEAQTAIICGISTALQWTCEEGGSTLQQILDGRPLSTTQSRN